MTFALLVSAAFTILLAGAAQATTTRYYSEVLTSNLLGNTRTVIDSTTNYSSLSSIMRYGTTTSGAGLGSGYVSTSSPLVYDHTFAPTAGVDQILSATLSIGVIDDQLFDGPEIASIYVDSTFWARGYATMNFFSGDVTAALIAGPTQDSLRVAIFSRGDNIAFASAVSVAYTTTPPVGGGGAGSPGPSVPEPSAALLFAAGFAVVRRAAHRT